MRWQASCNSSVEDAKERRKCGDSPKAVPGTPGQCEDGGRFDSCEARCEVIHGGPILDPASGYRRKTMAHKKSRTQLSGSAVAAGALRTNA